VSGRKRGAFVGKWAKELADYEPWDGGSQRSIERALERARTRANEAPALPRVRREIFSKEEEGGGAEERRALEQDLALQREWARVLAARVDARLRTFEGLFWWRLYLRLLPVLKPLRSLASFFTRRGSSSRTG
jgi:hypothetical protein